MEKISTLPQPAVQWKLDARKPGQSLQTQLRLAAMAAHMQVDKTAARRAALIDLLADGRPHTREEIWDSVAQRVGKDCWGKIPREALARDLATLRKGGIRIAYSRRPQIVGYYLQYPPFESSSTWPEEPINWTLIDRLRQLSPAEKNNLAFAAADFALNQKKLILAEENPDWSSTRVDHEARRLVFGVTPEMLP
ncbi:MAG: hypothetical protein ACK2T4_04750 [Candidatus Promineifilaceae bacterium]|jgi:hypothetical protein